MNEPKQPAKKHIITIAGRPGSGKSSTAEAIAKQLGYNHFSSGDFFRMIGKNRGIDVLQTNLTAEEEENEEIDHLVDQKLRDIGANYDMQVIDSRTAWHWMPFSFKVFLDLDLNIAAQRIINGKRKTGLVNERIPNDPAEYVKILQNRLDSETRRYKKLYDIDPYNMDNYNLVVDTATNNLEQTIELVTTSFKKWLKS